MTSWHLSSSNIYSLPKFIFQLYRNYIEFCFNNENLIVTLCYSLINIFVNGLSNSGVMSLSYNYMQHYLQQFFISSTSSLVNEVVCQMMDLKVLRGFHRFLSTFSF